MSDPSIQNQLFNNVPLGILAALFVLERGAKFSVWTVDKMTGNKGFLSSRDNSTKSLNKFIDYIEKTLTGLMEKTIGLLGEVKENVAVSSSESSRTHARVGKIESFQPLIVKDLEGSMTVLESNIKEHIDNSEEHLEHRFEKVQDELRKVYEKLLTLECVKDDD